MKITLKKLNNTVFEFIHGEIYNLGFDPTMAPVVTGDYRFNELEVLFESSDGDMYKPKPHVHGVENYCVSVEHLEPKPVTVVFCGSFSPFDRGLVKAQAIKEGMVVKGSVNIKTDLLVMGERCGVKVDKARKLNIPTITVEKFITNQLGFTDEQAQKELTTENEQVLVQHSCRMLRVYQNDVTHHSDVENALGQQFGRCLRLSEGKVFITLGEKVHEELNSYFNDEIEAFAEELFNINKSASNLKGDWHEMPENYKNGYRAMANHVSTPKTDIQQSLIDTLNSERELMGVLREIGKLFNVAVGVNIGLNDLPEHISNCVGVLRLNNGHRTYDDLIKRLTTEGLIYKTISGYARNDIIVGKLNDYRELCNGLVTALGLTYANESYTDKDLLDKVNKLTSRPLYQSPPAKPLVQQIKEHPELHDLITHLHDFKSAVEVREVISRTCKDDSDKTYWTRQLNTINKLIEITEPTVIK